MAKEWAKFFYISRAWLKCRDSYIKSVCGICERCGSAGYIVHHKVYLTPNNIHDINITLSRDNLEYLCIDCHNKEHKKNNSSITIKNTHFDANGDLIKD